MTVCSVFRLKNITGELGGNSNFSRPMPPTYGGCTVLKNLGIG